MKESDENITGRKDIQNQNKYVPIKVYVSLVPLLSYSHLLCIFPDKSIFEAVVLTDALVIISFGITDRRCRRMLSLLKGRFRKKKTETLYIWRCLCQPSVHT